MSGNEQFYIKKANRLFAEQKYKEAEACYEHAGKKLGMHLVRANLWLCKKRASEQVIEDDTPVSIKLAPVGYDTEKSALEAQLAETQTLVEKYYTEAQNLRFQLIDLKK